MHTLVHIVAAMVASCSVLGSKHTLVHMYSNGCQLSCTRQQMIVLQIVVYLPLILLFSWLANYDGKRE